MLEVEWYSIVVRRHPEVVVKRPDRPSQHTLPVERENLTKMVSEV